MSETTLGLLATILVGILTAFAVFIQQKGQQSPLWARAILGLAFFGLLFIGVLAIVRPATPSEPAAGAAAQVVSGQPAPTLVDVTTLLAPTVENTATAPPDVTATLQPTDALTSAPAATQAAVAESQAGSVKPSEDVPGPLIASGAKVTGIIDKATRPRDVYGVTLKPARK